MSRAWGVCSFQRHEEGESGLIGRPKGDPVILCPERFAEDHVLVDWLAEITGIPVDDVKRACERLLAGDQPQRPFPDAIRRPDWRSSGAKA